MSFNFRVGKMLGTCLFVAGLLATNQVVAQVSIPQEYDKTIKSAEAVGTLGSDLFGEQTNFYTGATTFSATDVSLPGNSGLPVQIGRRFVVKSREPSEWHMDVSPFGDWELDLPHLHGVFAASTGWQVTNFSPQDGWGDPNQRCSAKGLRDAPVVTGTFNGLWQGSQYWHGYNLYAPGSGDQEMLIANATDNPNQPTDGKTYRWITNNQWYFSCLPATANGVPGEGFLAIAPDGTRYTFNWIVQAGTSTIVKERGAVDPFAAAPDPDPLPPEFEARFPVGDTTSLNRAEVRIMPTRIEDRFGNYVTYTYDNLKPWRLTKILASDGRQLTLAYNASGHVSSVTDGTRSWSYTYSGHTLTTVTLPDTSKWTIGFGNLQLAYTQPYIDSNPTRCTLRSSYGTQPTYTGTITHPSGAVGEFKFKSQLHGRSYVPKVCVKPDPQGVADYAKFPYLFDVVGLTEKKISGPGLPAYQWIHTYGPTNNSWTENCPNDSCIATKTVEVAGPGEFVRYTFGNKYLETDGKLLKVERGSSAAALLQTESTTYLLNPAGQPYPTVVGRSPYERGDHMAEKLTPLLQRQITQQSSTFTWLASTFDAFANPLSVTRSSTLGYSRTDIASYHHNTAKWVIGQVASSTNSNTGLVESQTDYWPATALPRRTYLFGKPQQYFVYNADGTPLTVNDGNNHTTTFATWKRGIPQKITFADTKFKSAVVNDLGEIDSVTDENGYTTKYGYDAMGRLSLIDYPDADTVNWANTTRSFVKSGTAIYGLPVGHWQQTTLTGNGRQITYFDALWRPVVQATYDNASVAGTLSQSVTRYDADGRPTFVSYPQRSQDQAVYNTWGNPAINPNALGVWNTYDALGRPTKVQQNSELGVLTTITEYLTGFQTRTTNPRGFKTSSTYMAYDQPTTEWPMHVTHPEGAYTRFFRDTFGKPTALTRHNLDNSDWNTRYYAYDANQQLCKTTEVETGTTAYGYDAAGNLIWSAAALPWSPYAPCGYGPENAHVVPRRVDRTYDARNRLSTLTFPDGLGDQAWTYTPDGLPDTVTAYNAPGHTAPVVTAYAYNKRRLLGGQGETLSQPGWYSWGIGYGYNTNGHLASHAYPSGLTVTYAPNALGQPTQVGTYATGVSYHPNGAIKQFTYGNGIVHTLTQNARQLPDTSCDFTGSCGAGATLNDGYDYDQNGNVAAISDGRTLNRGNRTMSYDGLDRLKTVVSPMFGNATYAYNTLDDMTRVTIGGTAARDHYYCYDVHFQLTNVKTGSCAGTSVIGLGFDERGNLANKNGVVYVFDYGNRLRGVVDQESYRYDGLGRRALAWSPTLGNIFSQYSRDGQLMFQGNARVNPGLSTDYLYLGGSLVAIRELPTGDSAVVKYQHTDALGSPVAVTDANRVVIEKSEYEPYGGLLNRPLTDGPGYTGHVSDAATGLSYMQQRYYDPGIGRFLSVDPVTANSGTGANFNRYWYANNNPYSFKDPDGRQSCKTTGKTMTCDPEVKGMPTITIPKPAGFPNKIDSSQKNAHRYDKQKSAGPGTADKVKGIQQTIANDPTPGNDQPASPNGTPNNATPTSGLRGILPVNSPVLSYSATAPSGNTITLNVTLPGHPLHPGVVMRGAVPESGAAVVHNVGIGTGILQSNAAFGDAMFNNVWYDQSQRNIDAVR